MKSAAWQAPSPMNIAEKANRIALNLGVAPDAVTAAACLIVLARASDAPAVDGLLTAPSSGWSRRVALSWRAQLSVVIRRAADALSDAASDVVRVSSLDGACVELSPDGPRVVDPGPSTADLLLSRLAIALTAMRTDVDQAAGQLWLWSGEDERVVASAHAPGLSSLGTVADLIRRQIRCSGPAVAIEGRGRPVTYGELGELVDAFAGYLADAGVVAGDVVGVELSRGAEPVAALLALWSVGATYLPLDPDYPPLRMASVLARADARFAVLPAMGKSGQRVVPGCEVLHLTAASQGSDARPVRVHRSGTDEVAYAIATSGSTGQPKVVGVSHGALFHVASTLGQFLAAPAPRVAWTSGMAFDATMFEMLMPLISGGCLLVMDEGTRRSPERLAGWLAGVRPDVVPATSTVWRLLAPYLGTGLAGMKALCIGEALTADLAACLARTGAEVWNLYGPAEAAIYSTAGRVLPPVRNPVSIGRPLPGTSAAVLDDRGRPVPVGLAGELYLGGPQLATGYLNDPERTAAAFTDKPGTGRVYRTGDMCAWRADGTLEFRGRVDHQVKLRGHRLELGEIEAIAEQNPSVSRAVAVVVERDPGDQRLVLFYLLLPGACLPGAELRADLARKLPPALLPQRLIELARLPLSPNAKVDRQALSGVAQAAIGTGKADEEDAS